MTCQHPHQRIGYTGQEGGTEDIGKVGGNNFSNAIMDISGKIAFFCEVPHSKTGDRHEAHCYPISYQYPKCPPDLSVNISLNEDEGCKEITKANTIQHAIKAIGGMCPARNLPQHYSQHT